MITDTYTFVVGDDRSKEDVSYLFALKRGDTQIKSIELARGACVLLGYHESPSDIVIYLKTRNAVDVLLFSSITYSKETGKFGTLQDISPTVTGWPKRWIVANDNAVCFANTKDLLSVLRNSGDGPPVITEFPIKDKATRRLIKSTTSTNSDYSTLDAAYTQKKWYFDKGSLVLINDEYEMKNTSGIQILSFNTDTKQVDKRILELGYSSKSNHNSFLFQDHLFVWTMFRDKIKNSRSFFVLDVYDFTTNEKLKSYKFSYDDPFTLSSGDAYKNNGPFGPEMEKIPVTGRKTSDVTTRIGRDQPMICVRENENQLLEVFIGTFSPPQKTAGMPAPNPMGGVTVSAYLAPPSSASASFVIGLLNKSDLQPVPNQWELGNSESRKLEWINKSGTVKKGRLTTTRSNGKTFFVLFDADESSFKIDELK